VKHITSSKIAIAIAAVALFVAAGGPAQAASMITGARIKDGSVSGRDVRANSITSSDVRDIRGSDIRDGSLSAADFGRGSLPAADKGAKGDKGDKGDKGEKGDKGDPGPSRWLLVNAAGQIEAQSGGFRIANAYPPGGANGNVYIESGDRDLSNNGFVATLALQNQADQNGDGIMNGSAPGADANPEFSGEISTTRCAIPGVVACAPMDIGVTPSVPTNAPNYFVVSPRNSDGTRTADGTRKRFYVAVSGPQD
jgi:hypothetical protein